MEIFGVKIERIAKQKEDYNSSFVAPLNRDGALEVELGSPNVGGVLAGGINSYSMNTDPVFRNQIQLIMKYRKMALYPDVDDAITNICNDAITDGADSEIVTMRLDAVKMSDTVKKKMQEEFANIQKLLYFNRDGYRIFRDWYIDSKLMYHVIVDDKKKTDGIKELRWINPIYIKKIREVIRDQNNKDQVQLVSQVREYYVYKELFDVVNAQSQLSKTYKREIIISPESIINVTSGMMNETKRDVIGYLHKAIKPLNDMISMENSAVIYRLTRAPERRIFYIDVGNLPKQKAEQYVTDMMNKYKNKMVYDATSGEVENNNRHMTMLEDFWLPRREGGKGTEITTLQGGQNLGQIEDILFFQKKLFKSLYVPISRMQNESSTINFGRQAEVLRDELNFSKFINRLRKNFSDLFIQCLELQLQLKGVMTKQEWINIRDDIRFDFLEDAYLSESKESEVLKSRLETLVLIEPHIGKYYSKEWVRQNVLKQSEEDIKTLDKKMQDEIKGGEVNPFPTGFTAPDIYGNAGMTSPVMPGDGNGGFSEPPPPPPEPEPNIPGQAKKPAAKKSSEK